MTLVWAIKAKLTMDIIMNHSVYNIQVWSAVTIMICVWEENNGYTTTTNSFNKSCLLEPNRTPIHHQGRPADKRTMPKQVVVRSRDFHPLTNFIGWWWMGAIDTGTKVMNALYWGRLRLDTMRNNGRWMFMCLSGMRFSQKRGERRNNFPVFFCWFCLKLSSSTLRR